MSLSQEIVDFATSPNFAALTTVRPDGHPVTQVMWVDADADHVLINTERHRRKFRNLTADPRVTVTIWKVDNPYSYVEVRGVVADVVYGEEARSHIDRLSQKYLGHDYAAQIGSERVIVKIRPVETSKNAP